MILRKAKCRGCRLAIPPEDLIDLLWCPRCAGQRLAALERVAEAATAVLDPDLALDWRILTNRAAVKFRALQDALAAALAPAGKGDADG